MKLTRLKLNYIKHAIDAYYNHLNGIFCIYKPTGYTTLQALSRIKQNTLKDLNNLPAYDHEIEEHNRKLDTIPRIGGISGVPMVTNVPRKIVDYSKHKLVLGNMFSFRHVKLRILDEINEYGSGVVVCGIGKGIREQLELIAMAKYLRVYHVKGRFGYSTDNFHTDGKFVERTTYAHINKGKMDKVCGTAQFAHQKLMFECAGVDPNSQEAYELASQGLVRPAEDNDTPILYGIKCIYFDPPDFTLEVHGINETCEYLAYLINDIAYQLKSTAVCTHIHRLRYGMFTLDHTLLKKDWNINEIARNVKICEKLLTVENLLTNVQITSGKSRQQLDLLGDNSVDKVDSYNKDEIVKAKALKTLGDLRKKFLAEKEKSGIKHKPLVPKPTQNNQEHFARRKIVPLKSKKI